MRLMTVCLCSWVMLETAGLPVRIGCGVMLEKSVSAVCICSGLPNKQLDQYHATLNLFLNKKVYQLIIWPFYAKKCMKLKKKLDGEGGLSLALPLDPLMKIFMIFVHQVSLLPWSDQPMTYELLQTNGSPNSTNNHNIMNCRLSIIDIQNKMQNKISQW